MELQNHLVTFDAVTPDEFKSRGQGLKIQYGTHPTPFGNCQIATTARGICHLSFFLDRPDQSLFTDWKNAEFVENTDETRELVENIFNSQSGKSFHLVLRGTNFQIKVWEALLQIPAGCVVTYEDVAKQVGNPAAVRAVASAIGANNISYLIPCHRVIRKNGLLSGYRWSPARKRAMLVWESRNI